MDQIDKLLNKLTTKEQIRLIGYLGDLTQSTDGFNVKKIVGTEFYRARKGKFRIIFSYTSTGHAKVRTVRLRDEKTYRDF